ncbi:MAG: PorP/SprF family type IX secretion system membrane protein, partial [Bacteroidota bacterium]
MRNFYLLLICFCAPLSLLGQQEPLYAQYRTNLFVINPAYAGTLSYNELRLNYRSQWRRFPGAPQTLTMSYHGMVDEKNGLGFIAFNDAVGPDTRNGGQFSYAYHLPLGWGGTMGQNYLSLGVGVKLLQYQFRADRVFFADQTDPTIAEVAVPIYLGDASFGAYFHNDNFFAGISAPNLLQSDFSGSIDGSQPNLLSRLYRHYFAIFGYRFVYDNM